MSEIQEVNIQLDNLSNHIEQFGERMLEATQPSYDTIISKAQQARQLATELSGLMQEIVVDTKAHMAALNDFCIGGNQYKALEEVAQTVTAGTTEQLSLVPPKVTYLTHMTAGVAVSDTSVHTYSLSSVDQISSIANGLNNIAENLPKIRANMKETLHKHTTDIQTHIENNKL